MFIVNMDDKMTPTNAAKLLYNGMVVGLVVIKFAEIVTGRRLTP